MKRLHGDIFIYKWFLLFFVVSLEPESWQVFIGLGLFVSFTAISLKVCNQRCLWTTWQQMVTKNKVVLLAAVVYLPLAVKCVAALLVYAVRWVLIFSYCYTSYQFCIGYLGRVTDSKQWSQLTPVEVWHEFRTSHSALCIFAHSTAHYTSQRVPYPHVRLSALNMSALFISAPVFSSAKCPR